MKTPVYDGEGGKISLSCPITGGATLPFSFASFCTKSNVAPRLTCFSLELRARLCEPLSVKLPVFLLARATDLHNRAALHRPSRALRAHAGGMHSWQKQARRSSAGSSSRLSGDALRLAGGLRPCGFGMSAVRPEVRRFLVLDVRLLLPKSEPHTRN